MASRRSKRTSETLTRRELAAALNVHMQTVTKWEREGLPVAERGRKGKPSRYSELEVRAWLQAREEAARNDPGVMDLAVVRARKEHWLACLGEQTYLARARKLIPAEEVEQAQTARIIAARSLILSSYTAWTDRVHRAGVTDGLAGTERELKALAMSVLRELAVAKVAGEGAV